MNVDEYMSVSAAKSQFLEIVRRIEDENSKVVITKNGTPRAVLLSYDDFDGLLDTIDILADSGTVRGLRKGLKDIKEGRVVSLEEAFKD